MPLAALFPIAGALSAPAFFLMFALASLGAPFLALVCLTAAALRSMSHPEAYSRRLLRMALSCAAPALLVFSAAAALAAYRVPWLADWVMAAPLAPGLFAVLVFAYCASLTTIRFSRPPSRRGRQSSPLGQSFILAVLGVAILWLGLGLCSSLAEQARAVLHAPTAGSLGVAQLITTDITALPYAWTGLAALVALCAATAGAISLEYLLLRRDHEPFGREALAHVLRLAARCTLRSTLFAMAFLPVLWMHTPDMPALPGGGFAAKTLLGVCGGSCALICLFSATVAHSTRPWDRPLTIHANLLVLWLGLTALLSVGLLNFYAV